MHLTEADTTLRSLISPVQLGKIDQVMGTIFKKQIVSYGTWMNPDWWWDGVMTMELDEAFADSLIKNFNDKVFGKRLSVPLNHTGDVKANAGEVIKLEKGEGGLWAYLDIRDPAVVERINNGLIFDVSIGFDWEYVDQKTLKNYGPTLIHVALVTDPYLNDMDDFQMVDNIELSRRFEAYAQGVGFGKSQPSLIMMSKDKVEEMKRMRFAKVTNDKDYPVEVTYQDADGKDVTATLQSGEEIEVNAASAAAVTEQIANSTAPEGEEGAGEGEGEAEGAGTGEGEGGGEGAADDAGAGEGGEGEGSGEGTGEGSGEGEGSGAGNGTETPEQELARVRAENAELKANDAYAKLLSKGKITPAQKELFLSLAKAGQVTLSADVKTMKLAKGQTTSVLTMLSAILEAGPKMIKFGEQGGKGEGGNKVELTKEQEERIVHAGFNLETFKKQLAKGTITLEDVEEK